MKITNSSPSPEEPFPRERPAISGMRGHVDFAILTVKDEEFKAVLSQLSGKRDSPLRLTRDYFLFDVPRANGSTACVAVTRCITQGNGIAQDTARDIIADLDPQWILLVGIAGAAPTSEFCLGDVVIGSQILDLTIEALQSDGARQFALETRSIHSDVENFTSTVSGHETSLGSWHQLRRNPLVSTSQILERPSIEVATPRKYSGSNGWKKQVREALEWFLARDDKHPIVFPAPIAASDRLVKDSSLLVAWRKIARQVRVIEMESAGVHIAARGRGEHRKSYPTMSIRGISDIVGFERDDRWTQYACHSAAAFANAFVRLEYVAPRPKASDAPTAGRPVHIKQATPTETSTAALRSVSKPLVVDGRPVGDLAERIATERAVGWERHFVTQMLRDEIAAERAAVRDLRHRITTQPLRYVSTFELIDSLSLGNRDILALVETLAQLTGRTLLDAVFPSESDNDPEALAWVVRRIGNVYRAAIAWATKWLHTRCDWDEMRDLLRIAPELVSDLLRAIEDMPDRLDAFADAKEGDAQISPIGSIGIPVATLAELEMATARVSSLIVAGLGPEISRG